MAAAGTFAAPQGQAPQRTFRSGVDLVTLDVTVSDRDGRPLRDLAAADFVVTVDGRPRRVVSAQFVATAPPAVAASSLAPAHYSSNVSAARGRLLALIVDQGNISAGGGRPAVEAAARFLKRLPEGDRVGLHVIPGPGVDIPFSSNRSLVLSLLRKIAGAAPSSVASVADRECTGSDAQACAQEIEGEARAAIDDARQRARASIAALRGVVEQLATSPAPKTVVFLSESLVIENLSDLAWLPPLAAQGQITVHVLHLGGPGAGRGASRSAGAADAAAASEEGLSMLAGSTGGSFFRSAGNVERIFERIALGMAGYYALGFEPDDSDGEARRPRRIRVDVPKARGGSVRARQDFRMLPVSREGIERTVAETLRSPVLASEIGLSASAYVFPGVDSGALRLLLAAEIHRAHDGDRELALGYALIDGDGRVVASGFEPQLKRTPDSRAARQPFTASARAAPGVYTLKLAVMDTAGRRGSVQHTFRAEMTSLGQIRVGDLLIGVPGGAASPTTPAVAGEFTDPETLNGYVELAASSADALLGVSLQVEVAARGEERAIASSRAVLADAAGGSAVRTGQAVVRIDSLPAGDYVARAVIAVDGLTAGQIARPFRVTRLARGVRPAAGKGTAPGAAGGLPLRIEPFAREQVLTPEIVGFALTRAAPGDATGVPPEVASHARAGRLADALEAARSAGHALAAAFLQGLSLFAGGDLEGAAVKFREALRLDSEFFPAAFYLGSCYAAGGREREAAAAWQTSMATDDSGAPFIHALLADSLLRQREIERALDILREGMVRWPDDPVLQVRFAQALAMDARAAEALEALDSYLAAHPQDTDRLFLAMHLVYEATGGQPLVSKAEDLARFDRYAAAYSAAGGRQQALVDQWRRSLASRAR